MPRPGSHSYDKERARHRKDLERKGLSEQQLSDRVGKDARSDPAKRPQKTGGDRAAGPASERPARGRKGE
ncbi:hypothetical protein [Planomonospora venezuelensis]|uniref:Uncharacterized protein n=1 Tax=Planomonospora venezuelensis TaxID=1999 RepID=A0A841D0K1_PLAVE|nr:hypothetical protein [Planomonospora venezuelensis]MBB5961076.1 hypothetical protein [Planomonospora venezuelensis]GIN04755.1 hypothetical protein Pve01_64130 [Planomonospora venezuelensis]